MSDISPVSATPVTEDRKEVYVVEQTTALGWLICIAGCVICPPFNFLGLCMKEIVVVEVPCSTHG